MPMKMEEWMEECMGQHGEQDGWMDGFIAKGIGVKSWLTHLVGDGHWTVERTYSTHVELHEQQ